MTETFWCAIVAGGSRRMAWDAKNKCYYVPLFATHDDALTFWDRQEPKAWALSQVTIRKRTPRSERAPRQSEIEELSS